MTKTEQRAFAAFHENYGIDYLTIRSNKEQSEGAADWLFLGWRTAEANGGWRIRPVIIRVEDEETTHDH